MVGGAATAGIGFTALSPILQNVAKTYASFPSAASVWITGDWSPPFLLAVAFVLIGFATPFLLGLLIAKLVQPKDRWATVSAGLTAAGSASATAYLLWIGWMYTMAIVLVPSISDMTLLGNASRTPEPAAHPSDVLAESYPDLKAVHVDERGGRFFAKIVSDQVLGSASGIWLGVLISIACVGLPVFTGTLVASWLSRQQQSKWSLLARYIELTAGIAIPSGILMLLVLPAGFTFAQPIPWLRFAGLVGVSSVLVTGAIQRWSWPIRLVAAMSWLAILLGVGFGERTTAPAMVITITLVVGLSALFIRERFLRFHAHESFVPMPS